MCLWLGECGWCQMYACDWAQNFLLPTFVRTHNSKKNSLNANFLIWYFRLLCYLSIPCIEEKVRIKRRKVKHSKDLERERRRHLKYIYIYSITYTIYKVGLNYKICFFTLLRFSSRFDIDCSHIEYLARLAHELPQFASKILLFF